MNKPALITALFAAVLVGVRLLFFGSQIAAWKESMLPKTWRHWLRGEPHAPSK